MEGGRGGARRSKTLKESGSERVKDEGEVITVAVWKGCESEIIEQISGITDFYYPFCQQKLMEITGYNTNKLFKKYSMLEMFRARGAIIIPFFSKRPGYEVLFICFLKMGHVSGYLQFISHGWIDKEKSTTMRNFISKKKYPGNITWRYCLIHFNGPILCYVSGSQGCNYKSLTSWLIKTSLTYNVVKFYLYREAVVFISRSIHFFHCSKKSVYHTVSWCNLLVCPLYRISCFNLSLGPPSVLIQISSDWLSLTKIRF